MSLPLTRRIAQAALLVAAAAAPAVGAAGTASADALKAPDLGTLSAVDGAQLGNHVDSVSRQAGAVTTDAGNKVVRTALPAAGKALGTAGTTGKSTLQSGQRTTGQLAGSAGSAVGGAAKTVTKGGAAGKGLPTDGLAGGNVTKTLPSLGG
ncbi:ATP-binding protein [Streptomyces sp. I05A-00742]|uniref:ATP-binding protein n=1 Tax=Streptomyces sp. I05A-00742 TaxID=2732853 RepID=UPI00148957F6|nr:ATP-binding protein [Streptomyces sp. I05A-00742]